MDFVDDDSIQRLISGCIVLGELFIFSLKWYNLNEINICNPSLKRLTIEHALANEADLHLNIVIDAPSLVYLKLADKLFVNKPTFSRQVSFGKSI